MADEVHSLRTGTDDESRLFQRIFVQGERNHAGHQGVFVMTPGGKLLTSATGYDNPDHIRLALEQGLQAWKRMSKSERLEGERLDAFTSQRAEGRYPTDGLVLRVISRDLKGAPFAPRSERWSRTFLWFTRTEARSLVPAELQSGMKCDWPKALALRVAQFALLDKGEVDGYTHPFAKEAVKEVHLQSEILSVKGDTMRLRITGETRTETADAPPFFDRDRSFRTAPTRRGLAMTLLGTATFNKGTGRFTQFEMVALGLREGGAFVGRAEEDWSPALYGFSFTLGKETPAEQIAPEFFDQYGWSKE